VSAHIGQKFLTAEIAEDGAQRTRRKTLAYCTTSWKVVDSVGAPGELALTVIA
jgi:hypothetical protein